MIITVLNSLVWRVKLFKGFLEIFRIIKYGRSVWEFPPLPLYGQKINWKTLTVLVCQPSIALSSTGTSQVQFKKSVEFLQQDKCMTVNGEGRSCPRKRNLKTS